MMEEVTQDEEQHVHKKLRASNSSFSVEELGSVVEELVGMFSLS